MAELQLVDNTDAAAAHVLPVVASCPSPACVVYPYMPNGALSDRLRRRLGAPPLGYARNQHPDGNRHRASARGAGGENLIESENKA
jgi:hypothetical protein